MKLTDFSPTHNFGVGRLHVTWTGRTRPQKAAKEAWTQLAHAVGHGGLVGAPRRIGGGAPSR
jgi:hypothetical protein